MKKGTFKQDIKNHKLVKIIWLFQIMVKKHGVIITSKTKMEGVKDSGAAHGSKCSFCDLMILQITYEGINMGAMGCLMLIQALHEHITAAFGH